MLPSHSKSHLSRRSLMKGVLAGLVTPVGLGLGQGMWLQSAARASSGRAGTAKSCILLYMTGGPSQHETFDPKPDAPDNIRGEFRPIADVAQQFNNEAAKALADELDDRIDTLTRGFLGLTVSCARCHDHKYDPIPQLDYYSLAGVFKSCEVANVTLANQAAQDRLNKHLERIKLVDEDGKALVRPENVVGMPMTLGTLQTQAEEGMSDADGMIDVGRHAPFPEDIH